MTNSTKRYEVSMPTATYIIEAKNKHTAFRKFKATLEECDVLVKESSK